MVTISDRGVLFAKNSDRDPNEAQVLEWVPAAQHRRGALVRCTWVLVPQVARTRAGNVPTFRNSRNCSRRNAVWVS